MAHPCFSCGSECYCHGDIDDVVVSKTPANCNGCGCNEEGIEDNDFDEYDDDFLNHVHNVTGMTPVQISAVRLNMG